MSHDRYRLRSPLLTTHKRAKRARGGRRIRHWDRERRREGPRSRRSALNYRSRWLYSDPPTRPPPPCKLSFVLREERRPPSLGTLVSARGVTHHLWILMTRAMNSQGGSSGYSHRSLSTPASNPPPSFAKRRLPKSGEFALSSLLLPQQRRAPSFFFSSSPSSSTYQHFASLRFSSTTALDLPPSPPLSSLRRASITFSFFQEPVRIYCKRTSGGAS